MLIQLQDCLNLPCCQLNLQLLSQLLAMATATNGFLAGHQCLELPEGVRGGCGAWRGLQSGI